VTDTDRPAPASASLERLRPLISVRQFREFTDEAVSREDLEAIAAVARWSGSSTNSQPWRFVVVQDLTTIRRIAAAGLPSTRSLRTAMAAFALVLPDEPGHQVSYAYDEGRVAERILTAAGLIGLGAGIVWIPPDLRPVVRELLGVPDDHVVRTVMSLGHPTDSARGPRSAPGTARLPLDELVSWERWSGH
jgi:nitroreductase